MTNDGTMNGRTVCVTGASSGFGRLIAERLGANGAHVFLMGRTREPMEEAAATILATGGQADVADFDVTDTAALQQWIHGAAESTGRLDVLVNNAGFGKAGETIADGDPEFWKAMLDTNVLALAVGCQAAIKAMRATKSEGHIVNVSSVAAIRRESGVYGATKHAVNCINSTLRLELEDEPIRVTSIMPGAFATNFARNMDRETIEGFASTLGITDLAMDAEGRIPQHQIDQFQAAMSTAYGDAAHIAAAVEYVVQQPIELNIEELIIRPQKSLF